MLAQIQGWLPQAAAPPAPLPFLISIPTHHQPLFLAWQAAHTWPQPPQPLPQVPHLVPLSCPSLQQPRGSLLGGAVRGPWELSPHLHPSSCSKNSSPLLLPEAGPCHRSQLGQTLLPQPPPECVRGFNLPARGSSPAQGAGRSFPRHRGLSRAAPQGSGSTWRWSGLCWPCAAAFLFWCKHKQSCVLVTVSDRSHMNLG